MKKIVIIIFDGFTDIDLFLMWDILGRNKTDWSVKILGTNKQHQSTNEPSSSPSLKNHGLLL